MPKLKRKATEVVRTRDEQLNWWLDAVGARTSWIKEVPGVGTIEAVNINGRVLIVQKYSGRDGWEIYRPASKSNSVTETLNAAAEFCGVNIVAEA